jgi:hypothetical protein
MSGNTDSPILSENEAQLLSGIPVHVSSQDVVFETIKKIEILGMIRLRRCTVHHKCFAIKPTPVTMSLSVRSELFGELNEAPKHKEQ